jgi:hypothetical protein
MAWIKASLAKVGLICNNGVRKSDLVQAGGKVIL